MRIFYGNNSSENLKLNFSLFDIPTLRTGNILVVPVPKNAINEESKNIFWFLIFTCDPNNKEEAIPERLYFAGIEQKPDKDDFLQLSMFLAINMIPNNFYEAELSDVEMDELCESLCHVNEASSFWH